MDFKAENAKPVDSGNNQQQKPNFALNISTGGKPTQITGVAEGNISPTSTDAINGSQLYNAGFNLKTNGIDDPNADKRINYNETFNLDQGKNIVVKQIDNGFEVSTSHNIEVGENGQPGKPGIDGSVGAKGKDGSGVVLNGKDGSIGLNGKDGKDGLTIKGEQGPAGVKGADGETKTRIVYQPTDPNGNPQGEPEKVATLKDGLKFTGNNNDVINKHELNTLVNVVGEGVTKEASQTFKGAAGNINVKADGNSTLTVQLNENLTNLKRVEVGNTTINNGNITNLNDNLPSTNTVSTNNNGKGDVKSQTAPNITGDAGNNAATVNDVLNTGWNLQENGTAKDFVATYDIVNFVNGNGTIVTIDNTDGKTSKVKVDVKADGKTITTDPNGNLTVNTTNLSPNNDGTIRVDGDGNNLVNGTTVANAINNASHTIKSGNDGKQVTANNNSAKVKPGKTVTYNAGKNLVASIESDANGDSTVNYGLANDIDVNSVTTNNLTVKPGGNVNMGGNRVQNVAPGVNGTDAVNVNQLNQVKGDVTNVNNRVNKLDKRVRGIGANSAAAASLPQVYIPGKSMVAAAAGGYGGASAVAVGYSRASDNGKVILKVTGTANSAGHYSGGVGVGYQW